MFFRKRSPHAQELTRVFSLLAQADAIIMRCKQDKRFVPTPDELKLLDRVCEALHFSYAAADYVDRCLNQRARGEPEGSPK